VLLPGVPAFKLAAGVALFVGFHTMAAAGALSAFCALTAVVFHRAWSDRAERTLFFKDVAIAGALAMIAAN
jgi:putative oxidoreductase